MSNSTALTSLSSSSSSQSNDDSFSDRISSKSVPNNQTKFIQRFIGLGRLATQYSSQKLQHEHSNEQFNFVIHFLDETERTISIDRQCLGSDLFKKAFDFNDERDYFGLLIDNSSNHWLDPQKSLRKQFQNVSSSIHLEMKVRFYPIDPSNELECDFTKYLFVLQIKNDIFNGKLYCPATTSALLASYLVQIELGDYSPENHPPGYISDFNFVQCQNSEFESQVEHFHKQHRGQTSSESERNYLRLASSLEFYGIEFHQVSVKVWNSCGETASSSVVDLQLGISAVGLTVYQNGSKLNLFHWHRISKISYKRRTFSIQLIKEPTSTEENLIVFTVRNYFLCKCLWKSCVDQHTFFRHSTIPKLRMTENTMERMSNREEIKEQRASTLSTENSVESSDLRFVELRPTDEGRYGFNIKVVCENDSSRKPKNLMSEIEENRSFVINKIIENSPAMNAKLSEGDLLLSVNEIDIGEMTRTEVIDLIRSTRPGSNRLLRLCIRPIRTDDSKEKLEHSLQILREDFQSNRLIEQYETLARRHEASTFHQALKRQNASLNRYRDVLPYDQTRVILQTDPTTDYINANHIKIPIKTDQIVNRYIAAQGPLPTTTAAFWRMIWEQNCYFILMLTPVIENGRVKCHQYWPNVFESITYDCFTITCQQEQENDEFIHREFLLCNDLNDEERYIYQIQNHLWPDHGVPDDCSSFLASLAHFRNLKKEHVDSPVLVHCSAGIGRTGVFILIETGLSLIEQNQIVSPLDIVRQMREQRMGMIQTASQYQFACQAILFAYDHGLIGR